MSACTIDVLGESHGDDGHVDGDGHTEADHALAGVEHVDGDGHTEAEHDAADASHGDDHGTTDGGETRIDHHGNPIYDEEERVYEQIEQAGLSVEFTVENFIGVGGRGGELAPRLVEGEHANLQFRITDAGTGAPRPGLRPAVWLDVDGGGLECSDRIRGYLSGGLETRPAADLNSYFILGMNRDNTISVINPLVDVGGMTNLFSMILLQSTPQDWAMAAAESRLFVTLPDLDSVAVVDLDAFLVEDTIELAAAPDRIVLEPGGERVWVTLRGGSGVAVIDTATLQVDMVATGEETGAIAFSADGRRAIVGTAGGAVLVATGDAPRVEATARLGATPAAAAVSAATGDAYLVLPDAGAIAVVDVAGGAEKARLATDPGVADIDVSPDGRWAIAVSPQAETAYLLDTATSQISHVFPVRGVPSQVMFTDDAGYIYTDGSPAITAVPLAEIDPMGDLSVLTIPMGTKPAGTAGAPVTADAIMSTPDGEALLIANPADDTVYFFTEGSQSALGGFQGHTLQPRAVQVVDRSLKEPAPGVYTGSVRLPQDGSLVVALLLDEPSLTHCFTFTARPSDDSLDLEAPTVDIDVLAGAAAVAGSEHQLRFVLRNVDDGAVVSGLGDILAMVIQASGNWSARVVATADAQGTYTATFTPPAVGLYSVIFSVPSQGLSFQNVPPVNIQVTAP